jgi:hypothetical protein
MKNILDRLESVIESKGSKTLIESTPEWENFDRLVKKGASDKVVQAFLDCYKKNANLIDSNINEGMEGYMSYIFTMPFRGDLDLEVMMNVPDEDVTDASISAQVKLMGVWFNDIDDKQLVHVFKKYK